MMQCSVIIAFYNNIRALKLILAGLERQTCSSFEVIIADDGSRAEIVDEIAAIKAHSALTIRHLWHPDHGWQKNIMLNKAIVSAETDYLIFIDGDCIPDDFFVQRHLEASEPGYALAGRRVNLSPALSDRLTDADVRQGFFRKKFMRLLLDTQVKQSEKVLYVKLPWLARLLDNRRKRDLLGCNFSISKQDFLKLNGFDERFLYPGVGEDLDIYRRLKLAGMDTKSVAYSALVYHLYHKLTQIPQESFDLQKVTLQENSFQTAFGIRKSVNA